MATFVYQTAMRDDLLPRKPLNAPAEIRPGTGKKRGGKQASQPKRPD